MALDTRPKRASALSALRSWVIAPVLPDGTIGQGDRQHIAWMYSGILAGEAGPVVLLPDVIVATNRMLTARRTARSVTPKRTVRQLGQRTARKL